MGDQFTTIRLLSHQLIQPGFDKPKELVDWMGAIQAQDYTMAKWAVGIRLKAATDSLVEEAFNRGDFLRTHVLRPTWHFVSAADIRWMLKLSAQRIKASSFSRDRDLGITEDLYTHVNNLLEKILRDNNYLTREEIGNRLEKTGILVNSSRLVHFMMRAEVEAIVCSGPAKGKKQTYALLDERIPSAKDLGKEEALEKLARKYFQSHSPAGLQDFVWWSGLSVTEAREGIKLIEKELIKGFFPDPNLLMHQSFATEMNLTESIHLLPAFDEYLISYKDRTTVLDLEHHPKAFTKNGSFFPVIAYNGKVIGRWNKAVRKKQTILAPTFFTDVSAIERAKIEEVGMLYRYFLDH
ncbi:winged helix DNA-binding domain-containing protein [Parabacteroides sp. Marseille-P3160]|uniref:winged helix DNA-binding domain-containing protein n=1 Tax=Parabacteroides sp. Marseille-P3160 TaxID=1917887 RepID=UPI0009B971A9|nr:winged helix DNA-binding domain-containing protein [Parabacteroides sp. Marseille-P3160]